MAGTVRRTQRQSDDFSVTIMARLERHRTEANAMRAAKHATLMVAFLTLGCPSDDTASDSTSMGGPTGGEVTSGTTSGGADLTGADTTADRTNTGLDESSSSQGSPCGEAECPTRNPCEAVTCCGPDDPDCTPLFHDTNIQAIWSSAATNCDGCHGEFDPAGALSLHPATDPWCSLVDVAGSSPSPLVLIEPGQPLESYLWHKAGGTHLCPEVGGDGLAMSPPPGSCPLAVDLPTNFDALTEWICCGAPKSAEDPNGDSCFADGEPQGENR